MHPDAAVVSILLPAVPLSSVEEPTGYLGPVDAYARLVLDSVPHVVWTASADGVTTR